MMNHGNPVRCITTIVLLGLSMSVAAYAQVGKELLKRADSLVTAGKYDDAVALLDVAVARNPGNFIYLLARGRSHAAFQRYDDARRDYLAALAANHECALCMIDLAAVEAVSLHPDLALELVNRAIDLRKTLDRERTAEAYHLRAQVHETLGDRVDALLDYNRAVRLDPDNPDYLISRGMFHLLGGDTDEAFRSLNAAVQAAPQMAKPYFYRARYYATVREWEKGIADLDRCIRLDPSNSDIHLARGAMYLGMGRPGEALADYDVVIAHHPDNPDGYYNRALARLDLGDLEGSCSDSRHALELLREGNSDPGMLADVRRNLQQGCDSSVSEYYLQHGIAAYNRNDFTGAISTYNEGLAQFPGDPMLLYLRANAALAAGRHADAARDYEAVLAMKGEFLERLSASSGSDDPDDAGKLRTTSLLSVYHGLFEARQEAQNYDGALAALDMALALVANEKGPNLDKLYLERGALLLLKNDRSGALNDLDQAIALNPRLAPAHLFRAMALIGGHPSGLRLSSLRFDAGQQSAPSSRIDVTGNADQDGQETALLNEALGACNRAIELDAGLGQAYLVRGYIKILAGDDDHCTDLRRARDLGITEAATLLGSHCL